ncbi:hypothetical protein GSI_04158 [Ganoderma sinense ZZ0214-1]|uniref:Uncharacterized protein n=1 Tax=Ganoderma sinense ZZ0214-1 TaxID=1077348 RepID=A0A2G8SIC9_9APHY|nr:hypothetical protein GSI_04158 [Ganoderma sinense ZZ0214-1]
MSTNSTHEFPAPVGGVPDALDFAPSIFFAALYAILVPFALWRIVHPRSRNVVLIATTFFCIERAASFSLRATMARDATVRASVGIDVYLQTVYSGAFIAVGQDLANLLRALLVSSTLGGDMVALHKLTPSHVRKAQKVQTLAQKRMDREVALAQFYVTKGQEGEAYDVDDGASSTSGTAVSAPEFQDQTGLRKKIRVWFGVAGLMFILATIVSAMSGGNFSSAVAGGSGDLVRLLWYVSTALALVLLVAIALTAVFALKKLPRVPRTSGLWIIVVACLLSLVGIYRLTVISNLTTSLLLTGPGTHNAPADKAAFYVLQVAPEFLSIAILVSMNVRHVFGTGTWGDLRFNDPKPKSKPATWEVGGGAA